MTYLELYLKENSGKHPGLTVLGQCPHHTFTTDVPHYCTGTVLGGGCQDCWNREVPGTEVKQEATMTTDEKRQVIGEFCNKHSCHGDPERIACPFGGNAFCVNHNSEVAPDDIIDAWYELFFTVKPDPQHTGTTDTTETVNHPKHYGREGAMECIDEMVLVFGKEATANFCLLNSWKYRYRAGAKGGDEDLRKSDWYLAKYAELKGVI